MRHKNRIQGCLRRARQFAGNIAVSSVVWFAVIGVLQLFVQRNVFTETRTSFIYTDIYIHTPCISTLYSCKIALTSVKYTGSTKPLMT